MNVYRIRFLIIALMSLQCAISIQACAQSNACSAPVQSCIYSDPNSPNGIIVVPPVPVHLGPCPTTGPGCAICAAKTYACYSAGAANEVCPFCNGGRTAQAGAPIDLATGNVYVSQPDISVPGLGGGLGLVRTWNSLMPTIQNSFPSMFGPNWRSNYEERIITTSGDGYLKYARGDGSVWSFGFASADSQLTYKTAAPRNDGSTVVTGSSYYTLTSKSGEKRLFDNTTGALLSIIDRNGNTTQLTYDAQSRITAVTDSAGRVLESHTYDAVGRGLSSSRANGVGSVTVTYPQ